MTASPVPLREAPSGHRPSLALTAKTDVPWWPTPHKASRSRPSTPFLVVADVLAVLGCMVLHAPSGALGGVAFLMTAMAGLTVVGTYRSRLTWSMLDDLPVLIGVAAASALGEHLVPTLGGDTPPNRDLAGRALLATALFALGRALACWGIREAGRRGLIRQPALIIGSGAVGRQLATTLLGDPTYGLVPVGYLDDEAAPATDARFPVPWLGRYRDLAECIRRSKVRTVLVAYGRGEAADSLVAAHHDPVLTEAMRTCDRMDCEIYCVPRFHELHHRSRDMDEVWGVALVRIRRAAWRSVAWRIKRALDVVTAAVLLVVLSPLLLVIALAVLLEVGPDVLFRQVRVGLDGRSFTMLKFRTLRLPEGADENLVWSHADAVRVGPVGRLLRASSMDELPQLINVLRGEMSMVGPRPERVHFVEEFGRAVPGYLERHRAPAGLTGWAQVNGLRGDTSIEERARFDNYYIQNWSLWLDLKIIVRTVGTVVLRHGS